MAESREASPAPSGIKSKRAEGEPNGHLHKVEQKLGLDTAKEKLTDKKQKFKDKQGSGKKPEGGFDKTPIPRAKDGFVVRFTFHRADNLAISDINTLSSDPYIRATLTSGLAKRHKEDPELILRTPTVHRKTDPVWDYQWTVAGVPSSGFRLKCRLYDEDPSDHDDRLGNVTVHVNNVGLGWEGIKEREYSIKKRMGSKRGYLLRGCVTVLNGSMHLGGRLWLSMEVLGESEGPYGRMYTVGEVFWTKHFSPMIGRMVGTKAPEGRVKDGNEKGKQKAERYEYVLPSCVDETSEVLTPAASKRMSSS